MPLLAGTDYPNAMLAVDLHALDANDGLMVAGRWLPRAELDRTAPARATVPACPR